MNIIFMYNVLFYTTATSLLRKNLLRKKETVSRLFYSRALFLLQYLTDFIAKM